MQRTERYIAIKNLRILHGTVIPVRMEKKYTLRGKWSHLGTKEHERY